mgnify:CR=1 FL=1
MLNHCLVIIVKVQFYYLMPLIQIVLKAMDSILYLLIYTSSVANQYQMIHLNLYSNDSIPTTFNYKCNIHTKMIYILNHILLGFIKSIQF